MQVDLHFFLKFSALKIFTMNSCLFLNHKMKIIIEMVHLNMMMKRKLEKRKVTRITFPSCNYDVLLTAPLPDNLIAQNEGGLRTDWF